MAKLKFKTPTDRVKFVRDHVGCPLLDAVEFCRELVGQTQLEKTALQILCSILPGTTYDKHRIVIGQSINAAKEFLEQMEKS